MAAGDAVAGFGYAPGERRTAVLEDADRTSLVEVAVRLVPAEVRLRWDRRVDAGQQVRGVYGDWRTLLFDVGLAWARHGSELHVRPAGLPPGEVELASVGRGVASWEVRRDETLTGALARWGARAGVEAVRLTDRRYTLQESRTFRGTYREAVDLLMAALSELEPAPAARLSDDGMSLSILHRAGGTGNR